MEIGIMTFHWAINFGAVIQSYALQEAIGSLGYQVELIDYFPRKVRMKRLKGIIYLRNVKDIKREVQLRKFRKKYLKRSKRYASCQALIKAPLPYQTVFCGSDQIWNEWFTLHAEGVKTPAYYLPFGEQVRKISYAASFGTSQILPEMADFIKPYLKQFEAISMRENSGVKIIQDLGLQAQLVCDPTLLLDPKAYQKFIRQGQASTQTLFSYVLHGQDQQIKPIMDDVCRALELGYIDKISNSIEEWLTKIAQSSFVVTNSFHGTVFCILFHTPFVVVAVEGSDMGDRLCTLLDAVGLGDRYIHHVEELKDINLKKINWDSVDQKRQEYAQASWAFLKNCLQSMGS